MGLTKFFSNIRYLFRYNLKEINTSVNGLKKVAEENHPLILENLYEISRRDGFPEVMDASSTLDYLLNNNVSMCRFGDGEIAVMTSSGQAWFQHFDDKLAQRLVEILSSTEDGVLIASSYYYFNFPSGLRDDSFYFYLHDGKRFRKEFLKYMKPGRVYGDTSFTAPYVNYRNFDCAPYYEKFQQLWNDKDIVIICGRTVFDKIEHNIFATARSIEYIYGPPESAFDQYDELMSKALATDKAKTKFLILGQTATVMAYDLHKAGHRALDIGHIAKDYNAFMSGLEITVEKSRAFWIKD